MVGAASRVRQKAVGWLAHPRLPLHVALIAVALCLPALGAGLQLDDYLHRMILLDRAAHETEPIQAFSLMRGEAEHLGDYVDWGVFPWWTAGDLRLAFFRYVTVVTMWLDHRLWPESIWLMHAHSLLWLGALVAIVAVLYRRLVETPALAGLAALLYAVDEAHAGAATWLASRNALVATCFGVACLVAHDCWRRSGRRWGAWAGPLLLALALGSGEMALATIGYLAAYALCLDRRGPLRGTLALGGLAAVALAWAALYQAGGYGTRGSGLYLNPLVETGPYLAALPERLPVLLLGQWTAIPAELPWLLPEAEGRVLWLLGLLGIAALAALLVPLLRRDPAARFWTLGMALSLFPVAATFPSNRLLFFVGLGAMPLAAKLIALGLSREDSHETRRASRAYRVSIRAVAWLLLVQHLLLAPAVTPLGAHAVSKIGEPTRRAIDSLPPDEAITRRDLVIVNTPDYLSFVTLISATRAAEGRPYPERIRALSAGPAPIVIEGIDRHTVRVTISGGLYAGPLAELFRSRRDPLPPGTVAKLTGMTATVVAADGAGTPAVIDYRFERPLEDPLLRWMRWGRGGVYVPFEPPAPGERRALPPAWGPFEFFRAPC